MNSRQLVARHVSLLPLLASLNGMRYIPCRVYKASLDSWELRKMEIRKKSISDWEQKINFKGLFSPKF